MLESDFTSAWKQRISRRSLLKIAGVGLAAGLMSPVALTAVAANTQAPGSNLEEFMQVSLALSGKQQLNPQIGQRLYQLLAIQPGFIDGLAQLQPLPQGKPEQWSPTQQKTASEVLSAWYLGKVGKGAEAQVVSYEKALMFDAVAGVLVIRSYCSGKPGYWAAQPAAST
jgi:hypothetical protein